MFNTALMFWVAAVAVVLWGLHISIELMISAHYHPMAAKGDLFHPLRYGGLVLPCLLVILVPCLWLWRRPLHSRLYQTAIACLGIAVLLPLLPKVDSGYRQVYWLGETRHDIPWQYAPSQGSEEPGGTYF